MSESLQFQARIKHIFSQLREVPVDKFKRDLKAKKILYHINPLYFLMHDLELLLQLVDLQKDEQAREGIGNLFIQFKWNDDLLLVFVEGLIDCYSNQVAGYHALVEGSPVLKAFVSIYDTNVSGPGMAALGRLLKNRNLLPASVSDIKTPE